MDGAKYIPVLHLTFSEVEVLCIHVFLSLFLSSLLSRLSLPIVPLHGCAIDLLAVYVFFHIHSFVVVSRAPDYAMREHSLWSVELQSITDADAIR